MDDSVIDGEVVDGGYDGLSLATDDELLRQAKAWFRLDREHSADWRTNAKEDFDFVAGHQWTEDEEAKLKEELRPVITFNRIQPTVEAVVGLEIGNRREVKYYPRTAGDAAANEVLSAAAEWARDECDAEDEETDSFYDTVVCGMGWTDSRMEHEEDPDGEVLIERIDPMEMYWDCNARKRNLVDACRLWRVRSMPLSEARSLFPDADDADLDANWASADAAKEGEAHNADPRLAYQQGDQGKSRPDKMVTIVHLQWWERETYFRVADPFTGQIADLSEEEHGKLKPRLDEVGLSLNSVKLRRRVYKQAFLGGDVLERGPSAYPEGFSWQCMTGKRDQNKGTFYGMVRGMIDPQRWANKWLSQSLHILNTNAKGGLFAEKGAFDNDRDAETSYARSDRITWLKTGGAGKISPKPQPTFPTGFENLMQFAIASIRDVSGVNMELLGLRDAQQAGVLEEHRKQAGMTILATMFDSLRRYRKRQGRVLLYYITNYLSDGRLIRIVGEEGAKYVPLLKQPGVAEYDVIVDDSPSSPNQKERIWASIMQMLPMLGKAITPNDLWTLAEYSPLPAALVEKLQESSKQAQMAQKPQMEMQRQMAVQAHQSKMQESAAKVQSDQAGAQRDIAEAEKTRVETQKEAATPIVVDVPVQSMGWQG